MKCTPELLKPVELEDFLNTYWKDHSKLVIHREHPDYFHNILSIKELDRLVCSTRIPSSNMNLAKNNDPLPIDEYCRGEYVDQQRVLSLHRKGATIILRSMEQWSPPLAALRLEIEDAFEFEAQINVYLTPPGEKSTPPHWDTHDLFIMQIFGNKRWRLFEADRTLPLEKERFRVNEDFVGEITDDFILHAGDTLFLPRGVIHEPIADSYSIHISVGIRAVRWHDVCLQALQNMAQRDGSPLRETVNTSSAFDDISQISDKMHAIVNDANLFNDALEEVIHHLQMRRAIEMEGMLFDTIDITLPEVGTQFKRRKGVLISVDKTDSKLQITAETGSISLPVHMSDALDYALTGGLFMPNELPGLSHDEQFAACLALQKVGVLRKESAVAE